MDDAEKMEMHHLEMKVKQLEQDVRSAARNIVRLRDLIINMLEEHYQR